MTPITPAPRTITFMSSPSTTSRRVEAPTEFADSVARAETGVWTGPYRSSYGLHLVHLTEKDGDGQPQLEQIRPLVEREWSNDRRQETNERFYEALRKRYSIEIRLPDDSPDGDGRTARTR